MILLPLDVVGFRGAFSSPGGPALPPLPAAYFRHVVPIFGNVLFVLDAFVAEGWLRDDGPDDLELTVTERRERRRKRQRTNVSWVPLGGDAQWESGRRSGTKSVVGDKRCRVCRRSRAVSRSASKRKGVIKV